MDPLPPPPPPRGKSALAFFGILLLLFLPGILAQSAFLPAGLAWTQLFAFLLPAFALAAGSNLRPAAYLRLRKVPARLVLLGALAGVPAYLSAGAAMIATRRLLPEAWGETFDPARLFDGPPWERVLLALVAVLLAPPCEEIAFRGYVQTSLALRRSPAAAVLGAAALFAIVHLDPIRFPAVLLLGLVFGWLTWRAGSVWPAVAAHAVNNGITSGIVLLAGVPAQGEEPPLSAVAATAVLGLSLLALVLAAFRAATPAPPPAGEALSLADPADPSTAFSPERVPPRLLLAAVAGLALLALLVLGAVFSEARLAQ